jgi:hypothetical protein
MTNKDRPSVFVDIERFIYCGYVGSNLRHEHAIPVSLLPAGEPGMVLRKASCVSCASRTSAFERAVLRKYYIQQY